MGRTSYPKGRMPSVWQIVVVLGTMTLFALALPVGVNAVGQLVTLVDDDGVTKAQVESTGSLRVAEFNDPARLSYTDETVFVLSPGDLFAFQYLNGVPPGQRLVIETISVWAWFPVGQRAVAARIHIPGGTFYVPLSFAASTGIQDHYQGTERVQLYVDPESSVVARFSRTSTSGTATAKFAVSGHFVNL